MENIEETELIDINGTEEDIDTINSIDDINNESIQSPEYDKYRNLLNIFNDIELKCIEFKDKFSLGTFSFMKWLSIIVEEIGKVSQELNNLSLNNNEVNEIRIKLTELAAVIVSWIEVLNEVNPQNRDSESKKEVSINSSKLASTTKMCPDCIRYMFVSPKSFCSNLEHIKISRDFLTKRNFLTKKE